MPSAASCIAHSQPISCSTTPIDGALYKDKALARAIIERLRDLGYVGPDFGHSDPGLQDRKLIVLEAPEEFSEFAKKPGWKNLAEEFDDE